MIARKARNRNTNLTPRVVVHTYQFHKSLKEETGVVIINQTKGGVMVLVVVLVVEVDLKDLVLVVEILIPDTGPEEANVMVKKEEQDHSLDPVK